MAERKKILLTRLVEDNKQDRQYFEKNLFEIVEVPLLALKPINLSESEKKDLEKAEWILLTSQHAARFLLDQGSKKLILGKKFGVIGEKTGAIVRQHGITSFFQSKFQTKKKFFEHWHSVFEQPTTIFYPKSDIADCTGEAWLRQLGYKVFAPVLYKNFFPETSEQLLLNYIHKYEFTGIFFASPSCWRRFLSVYEQETIDWVPDFYCVGETTQKVINDDGYSATIVNTKNL